MSPVDQVAGADLALAIAAQVPDHLAPDVVALGFLSYLTELASHATAEQRRRMAVMACNAASELAGMPPLGG